jgi:hypothetical protein
MADCHCSLPEALMPLPRITLRNFGIAAIVVFVAYGEYVIWFKSPIAQVSAICDKFRTLKEAAATRGAEPFHLIDEASAAGFEPYRLIYKAVRACDGEAIDVEDSNIR